MKDKKLQHHLSSKRNHFSLPRLPLDYEGIFTSDEENGLKRDSEEGGAGLNTLLHAVMSGINAKMPLFFIPVMRKT